MIKSAEEDVRNSVNNRILIALITLVLLCVLVYSVSCDHKNEKLIPPCPMKYYTGYFCPGCGSLRAIQKVVHFDLLGAMSENFFAVMFFPLLIFYIATNIKYVLTGTDMNIIRLPYYVTIGIAVFFILFWILRNVPFYPFSVLAPGF